KYREGNYVLFQFASGPDVVKELERRLRVSDSVLKFMTVRIDENLKRLEKRKKARDKRSAKRAANAPAAPAATPGAALPGTPLPGAPGAMPQMTEAPAGPVPGLPKEG